jgi:hypothetical protein
VNAEEEAQCVIEKERLERSRKSSNGSSSGFKEGALSNRLGVGAALQFGRGRSLHALHVEQSAGLTDPPASTNCQHDVRKCEGLLDLLQCIQENKSRCTKADNLAKAAGNVLPRYFSMPGAALSWLTGCSKGEVRRVRSARLPTYTMTCGKPAPPWEGPDPPWKRTDYPFALQAVVLLISGGINLWYLSSIRERQTRCIFCC